MNKRVRYPRLSSAASMHIAGSWSHLGRERDIWRPLVQPLLQAGLIPQIHQVAHGFVRAGFRNPCGHRFHGLPGHMLQVFFFCLVRVSWLQLVPLASCSFAVPLCKKAASGFSVSFFSCVV